MFQHPGGNWPVGHMRRLSLRAAKGGDAAGDARVTEREGRGRESVCEYMCSRITNLILQMDPKTWKQWNIWNAAAYIMPMVETRGGTDGNIVRADPYSPKARRREGCRGSGKAGKRGESGSRQSWADERAAKHAPGTTRSRARRGRRTVPVHSNRVQMLRISIFRFFRRDNPPSRCDR